MFEGNHVKWGIWSPGQDIERRVRLELIKSDFTSAELLILIQELMAVRDRLRTDT